MWKNHGSMHQLMRPVMTVSSRKKLEKILSLKVPETDQLETCKKIRAIACCSTSSEPC